MERGTLQITLWILLARRHGNPSHMIATSAQHQNLLTLQEIGIWMGVSKQRCYKNNPFCAASNIEGSLDAWKFQAGYTYRFKLLHNVAHAFDMIHSYQKKTCDFERNTPTLEFSIQAHLRKKIDTTFSWIVFLFIFGGTRDPYLHFNWSPPTEFPWISYKNGWNPNIMDGWKMFLFQKIGHFSSFRWWFLGE